MRRGDIGGGGGSDGRSCVLSLVIMMGSFDEVVWLFVCWRGASAAAERIEQHVWMNGGTGVYPTIRLGDG